jgi:hypothetical protein
MKTGKEKILSYDNNIKKSFWLSWDKLFNEFNLDLDLAKERSENKYYQKVRLWYPFEKYNRIFFFNYMLHKKIKPFKAHQILDLLDNKQLTGIDELIKIHSVKNHDINYYIFRGYSEEEANQAIIEFFQKGSAATQLKRQDPEYNEKFIETRRPGGKAAGLNRNSHSKMENKIIQHFQNQNNFKLNIKFHTPIEGIYKKIFNRGNNFAHDLLVDNFIIEYNGSYWHKDYLFDNRFSKDDYMLEIYKAKYCINYQRSNRPNYIVLWEADFKNFEGIIEFLNSIIYTHCHSTFFSSRKSDYELFNEVSSIHLL